MAHTTEERTTLLNDPTVDKAPPSHSTAHNDAVKELVRIREELIDLRDAYTAMSTGPHHEGDHGDGQRCAHRAMIRDIDRILGK